MLFRSGVRDVARLPTLPTGALGLVSVVAKRPAQVDAPLGWQIVQRDSAQAVGAAHRA